MALLIKCANVLDAEAEALILTIDGARRGMEGNIARQFAKRYEDDWFDLERALPYPIPLGRAVGVAWDGDCPWRLLIVASTLHHVDVLDAAQKTGIVRSACSQALTLAGRHGARSVASAVMAGGWRLGVEAAFIAMGEAYLAGGHAAREIDFLVCVPTQAEAARISKIAEDRRWGQ